jgi:hypothetical protein
MSPKAKIEFFEAHSFKERVRFRIEVPRIQLDFRHADFSRKFLNSFHEGRANTLPLLIGEDRDVFNLQKAIGIGEGALCPLEQFAHEIAHGTSIFLSQEESYYWICQHFVEEGYSKIVTLRHFEEIRVMFSMQALHIHT